MDVSAKNILKVSLANIGGVVVTEVEISPEIRQWALKYAECSRDEIRDNHSWVGQGGNPSVPQLKGFSKAAGLPVHYMLLKTPPNWPRLPPDVHDFRGKKSDKRPSSNLLDTLYSCQHRQDWYRSYLEASEQEELPFVGSASCDDSVVEVASKIRHTLGFDLEKQTKCKTWEEALRTFAKCARDTGVLVMVNGVVGNNPHRRLDPDEFRGFALSDRVAPLIFINGKDSKSAQMFTLAHELAHLWLGKGGTGISNADMLDRAQGYNKVEKWCDQVAAELLVPTKEIKGEKRSDDLTAQIKTLTRRFKVSSLVILRRLRDTGAIEHKEFTSAYGKELALSRGRRNKSKEASGGNFYATLNQRVDENFARALILSTSAGETLFTEAVCLFGVPKMATLESYAKTLGLKL